MTLREYLFKHKIQQKDFADQMGCARPYISNICSGRATPGPYFAKYIQDATKGEVTIEELRPNAKELRRIL